jgi:hypothetical protein
MPLPATVIDPITQFSQTPSAATQIPAVEARLSHVIRSHSPALTTTCRSSGSGLILRSGSAVAERCGQPSALVAALFRVARAMACRVS